MRMCSLVDPRTYLFGGTHMSLVRPTQWAVKDDSSVQAYQSLEALSYALHCEFGIQRGILDSWLICAESGSWLFSSALG